MGNDKKDKGYDASMLRFVGNLLAGDASSWQNQALRPPFVDAAIETAKLARKGLRKLQESEESK